MFKNLRSKIVFLYTVLSVILIAVFYFYFIGLTRDTQLAVIKNEMAGKLRLTEKYLDTEMKRPTPFTPRLHQMARDISKIIDLRLTIISLDGAVLADSSEDAETMDNHRYRDEVQQSIERGIGESIRYSTTIKTHTLYTALKSENIIIRLAKPLNEIDQNVRKVQRLILILGVIMLAAAFLVTLYLSNVITRGIYRTIEFAEDFSRGDLERRIFDYSEDEIGKLQKSLNRLADTLQEKINTLVLEQLKLHTTIQSINDGIAVIDSDRKIILSNRALDSLLEINTIAVGKYYYEVIRNSTLNARIEKALPVAQADSFEVDLLNDKFCDVYLNPIREELLFSGIIVVLHDITERKRIMQIKTELVGNLSHELKTPIAILRGYLETIYNHSCDAETAKDFIKKALINVDRQNSIVNDMLKLNMLETSFYFPTEEISIRDMIANCLNILAPKLNEKTISVSAELDMVPESVTANRFLAEEIFFNLIDNAINYNTPEGKITITSSKGPGTRAIAIADTGIGIPEESLGRVFERFYRVNKSRSRSTGGTGLGLSIVKHAVDLLGWKITVESGREGSVFTISIPHYG
ncbi:MAG TPA: HAMP domain-containing protein [Spirochaetes bacterium]|nr:HAMP domain-containing protein [Spirochaetota bacterium]